MTYLLVPIQLLPQAFDFCCLVLAARINLIICRIGVAADEVALRLGDLGRHGILLLFVLIHDEVVLIHSLQHIILVHAGVELEVLLIIFVQLR